MVAVAVGVGQEDDLAVPQPGGIVLVVDPAAEGADEVGQFLVVEQLGLTGLLDVQDLPTQRQNRLKLPVAPLLGRATRAVALDDEQLRLARSWSSHSRRACPAGSSGC